MSAAVVNHLAVAKMCNLCSRHRRIVVLLQFLTFSQVQSRYMLLAVPNDSGGRRFIFILDSGIVLVCYSLFSCRKAQHFCGCLHIDVGRPPVAHHATYQQAERIEDATRYFRCWQPGRRRRLDTYLVVVGSISSSQVSIPSETRVHVHVCHNNIRLDERTITVRMMAGIGGSWEENLAVEGCCNLGNMLLLLLLLPACQDILTRCCMHDGPSSSSSLELLLLSFDGWASYIASDGLLLSKRTQATVGGLSVHLFKKEEEEDGGEEGPWEILLFPFTKRTFRCSSERTNYEEYKFTAISSTTIKSRRRRRRRKRRRRRRRRRGRRTTFAFEN